MMLDLAALFLDAPSEAPAAAEAVDAPTREPLTPGREREENRNVSGAFSAAPPPVGGGFPCDRSGPAPVEPDLRAYVLEHGCYPPEGVGRPDTLDRWLENHLADGFARWVQVEGGWERIDLPPDESPPEPGELILPPDPCPVCGSLRAWWDVMGGQHCGPCEPPTRGLAFLERAKADRRRAGR